MTERHPFPPAFQGSCSPAPDAGIAGSNQLIINKLHGNEFAPGVVAKGVWRKPEKH